MKKYDKLLFVSHSDTCRGPMAEAIMQNRLLLEDIIIESKGMIVLFPEPVNSKAQEVLKFHGLAMEDHAAAPFGPDDFDRRTLILTMQEAQKEKILKTYGDAAVNVYSLAEYIRTEGDIYDPLGKDLTEYGRCFDNLEKVISKLAVIISEEDEL